MLIFSLLDALNEIGKSARLRIPPKSIVSLAHGRLNYLLVGRVLRRQTVIMGGIVMFLVLKDHRFVIYPLVVVVEAKSFSTEVSIGRFLAHLNEGTLQLMTTGTKNTLASFSKLTIARSFHL